jgi:flagellin
LADGTTAINLSITQLDTARDTLRVNSTALSNKLSTVTIRQDFTDKMINTLEDGAANLTNADLNEEGANLLMLQTRQQLGTTSLSMASQAAQAVLRLF